MEDDNSNDDHEDKEADHHNEADGDVAGLFEQEAMHRICRQHFHHYFPRKFSFYNKVIQIIFIFHSYVQYLLPVFKLQKKRPF